MDQSPPFTFAGRLVILISIIIAIGGTTADVWYNHESLEGSFPLIVFAFPAFLAAGLFGGASVLILRLFGIRFFNDHDVDE
ncbi:MAG TPA: hypothetical protein VGM98_01995 [Schlesneria sp.]|jgi:uncharacterized integral membrane protein